MWFQPLLRWAALIKNLQLYLGELQKMIYEQYLPAFEEVGSKP